nr:DNA mismatch repair protein MutS [Desulfobacteraceae bacterium]
MSKSGPMPPGSATEQDNGGAVTLPPKITPMLQQYLEIKNQYRDAILFYRLGDFYEMFFDDAVTASRVLGITLTSRNHKDEEHKVPLCGVPYHAAAGYLAKLVKAGYRVAVCEQVEDPREAKGVVRREVVRVVTPGLVTEEQLLDDKENCYVAAVCCARDTWGLSLLDLSTGEFLIAERETPEGVLDELARLVPSELLLAEGAGEELELAAALQPALPALCLTSRPADHFHRERARELLTSHFGTVNLAGFGCDELDAGLAAAGGLFIYIQETQKTEL